MPLSLSTSLNSFLTIFRPDPCVLPIRISLPDLPLLLATFPLGPFLCLQLQLGTLYLYTFVLSIPVVKVRGGVRRGSAPLLRLWRSLAPLLESEPSLPTAGPKLLNSTKNHNVRCRINKF